MHQAVQHTAFSVETPYAYSTGSPFRARLSTTTANVRTLL